MQSSHVFSEHCFKNKVAHDLGYVITALYVPISLLKDRRNNVTYLIVVLRLKCIITYEMSKEVPGIQ